MASASVKSLLKNAEEGEMPLPGILPMLATLVEEPPKNSENWAFEIKWDGYRTIAHIEKGSVELWSRNAKPFLDKYTSINIALSKWKVNAIIDGEIVVLNEKGISDFNALQNWGNNQSGQLAFYVFDILYYEGKSLTGLTFKERRAILEAVFPSDLDNIQLSKIFNADGEAFESAACEMGLEGIIAKRIDSLYSINKRSDDWQKIKCNKYQEAVVCGYTKNEDSHDKFSSLTLGIREGKEWKYVGNVGTGFSRKVQEDIFKRLTVIEECPFKEVPDLTKPSRFRRRTEKVFIAWCKPELVCEVAYLERTEEGHMRHSSFKGLRPDKAIEEVVIEEPKQVPKIEPTTTKKPSKQKGKEKEFLAGKEETETFSIDGQTLKFSNLNKIYWPEEKYTKRQLIRYYHEVAEYIIPYLKDRIQNLHRYPDGIKGERFYQKNLRGTAPEWIETVDYVDEDGAKKEAMLCNNEATLLYMANLGCIEINPFFNRIGSENPDYSVIDLDPADNPFEKVIEAAQITKKILDAIEVPCYAKTSGSSGIHIYIPLGAKYSMEQSQMFAKLIVTLVNQELPSFTTIERFKTARKGKMYLDFLQNRPGATVASVYCVRPKPLATVSMPLHWDEVKTGLKLSDFTIFNAPARLKETGDLFEGVLAEGIDLGKALKKMNEVFK